MSSTSWTWDAARQSYCYWSAEENTWVYQDGTRLTAGGAQLGTQPMAGLTPGTQQSVTSSTSAYESGHDISIGIGSLNLSSQQQSSGYHQQYVQQPYLATGYTAQTSPEQGSAIEPVEWKGVQAHRRIRGTSGKTEKLDPGFHIRKPSFFKLGKVFKVLWPELATSLGSARSAVSEGYREENFVTKIRWFTVVKEGKDHCSCLPIQTYASRGVAKPGTVKWHHAIVYTEDKEPEPTSDELPGDGEYGMMQGIRVTPRSKRDRLDKMSRINFAKIYTVEHNVKVYEFGDVHPKSINTLKTQWKYVMNRDSEQKLDEEDEDEGRDEEDDNDDLTTLTGTGANQDEWQHVYDRLTTVNRYDKLDSPTLDFSENTTLVGDEFTTPVGISSPGSKRPLYFGDEPTQPVGTTRPGLDSDEAKPAKGFHPYQGDPPVFPGSGSPEG